MDLTRTVTDALGPMEEGTMTTDDGQQLCYQLFGDPSGPAVVIGNGIGVRYWGFARQIEAIKGSHRIICWDYRGMGASSPAGEGVDVSMPRQARDMKQLMDHLQVEQAVLVGWSMGVQVSLELIRAWPERAAGFVAMLGTYGRPFRTGLPTPLPIIAERLFEFGSRYPAIAQLLLDFGVAFPDLTHIILSSVLFAGADIEREILDANIAGVKEVEKGLYLRTIMELAEHDASDSLERVPCPALVICGDRDWITPPRSGKFIAESIPGGQYREVAGGTHFALIEQPGLINTWLEGFLGEVNG